MRCKINLAKFFTWTGGMLVVVAAGVLAYGFHDLQEADCLPGLTNRAFDISGTIPPDSWYGTLLKGVLNFQPDPTVLQVTVWLLYLIPTLALFLAPVGFASGKGKVKAPDEQGSQPPAKVARRLDADGRTHRGGSVTVLSLTASGCVVVHGEREVLPAATQTRPPRR